MKKIYIEPSIDVMAIDCTSLLITLSSGGKDNGDGAGEAKQRLETFGSDFNASFTTDF